MKRQHTKEKLPIGRGCMAVYYTGVILVVILLVSGCAYPLNSGNTGSVSLVLPELNIDDLVDVDDVQLPGRSADGVAGVTWTFSGTGPGGVTATSVFTPDATLVTLTDLVTGSWTFNLEAKLGETLLAQGRAQTTLRSGANTVQMVVRGAMGLGATTVVPYEEIEIELTVAKPYYNEYTFTVPDTYSSYFWYIDDELIQWIEGSFYLDQLYFTMVSPGVIRIVYENDTGYVPKKITVLTMTVDETYRGDIDVTFVGGSET